MNLPERSRKTRLPEFRKDELRVFRRLSEEKIPGAEQGIFEGKVSGTCQF